MPGIFSVRGFDETWAGKNHQRSTSIIQYTHICMCIYIYMLTIHVLFLPSNTEEVH